MDKTKKTTISKTSKKPVVKKPVEAKISPVEKKIGTAIYFNKDIKIVPRKFRLLVRDVVKLNPFEAIERLKFVNTNGARFLVRDIKNAIANAKHNYHLNPDTLKFKEMRVNEGTKIKRMDKSHGYRYSRGVIIKRHSRLNIILSGEELIKN